jgi:glycosyltransferase involved in cell wall biosynthesis
MLPRLAQLGLPVIVVDDGSGTDVVTALQETVDEFANVELLERERNGGKGAAMISGLRAAAANGCSHVISLDADGQHDVDDIPRLKQLSQAAPTCLFSGRPVFGDDIPASRLYGRMLTNYLVQFVTTSRMVRDAMCGLRVYPLRQVLPLCDAIGYRTRMEFDIEILVRACWAGLRIESMETVVTYPRDGESHFHIFADNVRLVGMHVLLILNGLIRMPRTLWRSFRGRSTASG